MTSAAGTSVGVKSLVSVLVSVDAAVLLVSESPVASASTVPELVSSVAAVTPPGVFVGSEVAG